MPNMGDEFAPAKFRFIEPYFFDYFTVPESKIFKLFGKIIVDCRFEELKRT